VLRAVIASALFALALPASAQAALSFSFDRAQARSGQVVHAFQTDSEGNPSPAWGNFDASLVTIYLVRVRAPHEWRLKLGPMRTNTEGVWDITFRAPKIRPGLYTIAFFCRPCGNTFFPSTLPGTPWTPTPSRVLKIRAAQRH
jgi:hypothetical protein